MYTCGVNVFGQAPIARKFDGFGDVQLSDLAARLDNFAIALQNEPQQKGFIMVYRSRRDLPGLSSALAEWSKNYLVYNRGFAEGRIIAIDGGIADCVSQEFWLVPLGAAPTARSDAYDSTFEDLESTRKFYADSFYARDFVAETYSFDVSNAFEGYSQALRKAPKSFAYLIGYAGYRTEYISEFNKNGIEIKRRRRVIIEPVREARRQIAREKALLVNKYKIPASRIRTTFGGYRDWPTMELWIVPGGAHAPIATPNKFARRDR
jgi:hypothetical protein